VLSAYGLALADVVEEVQEPCSLQYEAGSYSKLDQRIEELSQRCDQILSKRGFSRSLSRIVTLKSFSFGSSGVSLSFNKHK